MWTISQFQEMIRQELSKKSFVETPEGLFDPIVYMMEDAGKRLRPLLAMVGYAMYRDDVEKVLRPAIGIEIFHNYTLLHDDVMDDAPIRRGRPTVHKKWGSNVAILSGDAAAITAYKYVSQCDDRHLRRVLDDFNQVATDVCKGQQYDMEYESEREVSEEEYIHMITLKTAVLLAGSLRHGATMADAPDADCKALYNFGIKMGLAFQIQDDYLDVYGNTSTFGKRCGGDIVANKKTYPLIKALALADKKSRDRLITLFSSPTDAFSEENKIKEVKAIFDSLDMQTVCLSAIDQYLDEAKAILREEIDVEENRKQLLTDVIDMLWRRDS